MANEREFAVRISDLLSELEVRRQEVEEAKVALKVRTSELQTHTCVLEV
jgi:hypothetical protein